MRDKRVAYLRGVVEKLVDSLDATLRISRWDGHDGVPEPLKKSAGQLLEHLGAANRLAADRFVGPPVMMASMTAMTGAIQKLDTAFVEYRRSIGGTAAQRQEGELALHTEIDRVRADAHRWS